MYDSFMIQADSLKNDVVNGETVGFQFIVRLANYRGIYLSLASGFYVSVDGVAPKSGPAIYTASAPQSMAAMPISLFLAGASSSRRGIT